MTADPRSEKRRERLLLLGLVGAAFVLRLLYLGTELSVTPDGTYYLSLGRSLIRGDLQAGLSPYWSPLYPLLIGLSSLVFHPLELAGRMVSVFAGTLLLFPLFALARSTWGARTAWIAVGLTAVHPELVLDSVKVLSEATYTLLFLCALWLGSRAIFRHRVLHALLCGATLAGCYLVRPEAFLFAPLFGALILAFGFYERRPLRETLWRCVACAVVFSAVALPYIVYLKQDTGHWTISTKLAAHLTFLPARRGLIDGKLTYQDVIVGGKPMPQAAERSEKAANVSGSWDPKRRLIKIVRNVTSQMETAVPRVFSPLYLVLFGMGLVRRDRSPGQGRRESLLLAFGLSTLGGYALTMPLARYLTPLMPLVLCWVAAGMLVLFRRAIEFGAARRFAALWPARLTLGGLLLVLCLSMAPALSKPFRSLGYGQPVEMRLAGEWIRDHGRPNPLILADNPVVAYYAQGTHYYLPTEPVQVLVDYARRRGADYLVLTRLERRGSRQVLREELLSGNPARFGLRRVFESDEVPGAEVFVFELLDREPGTHEKP